MLQYIEQTQIRAVQRDMDQSQQTTSCKKVVLQEVAIGNLLLESPKMGRLAVNFRAFFLGICSSKSWCVLIDSTIAVSPLQSWSFPMFFSHGHHHHAIHQATLKGTTNKAICEDEPRATPSERSILFFRATSTWAPDHSTIVGI